MFLLRLVALAWFLVAAASLHGQTAPEEYATFMSHGKAVSCPVYGNPDAIATMIFLHGPSPADLALGRLEANFFAEHGFRVLLPDYLIVTASAKTTAANYRRWAQVAEDIVADLRSHPIPRKKIALAGQALGASVALVAASQKIGVDAVAEWSGGLPNEFFSQVQSLPPFSSFTATRISRFRSSTPASSSVSASLETSPAKPEFIPARARSLAPGPWTQPTSAP